MLGGRSAALPAATGGLSGRSSPVVGYGRPADAETILLAAIDRFPAEAWPRVEYAELANTQQDWTAAEARWAAVRAAWPGRQDGYLRAAEALAALGRQDEAAQLRAEHRHKFAH